MMILLIVNIILLQSYLINSDIVPVGNAYTLLDKTNTDCEMNSMNIGSKLVDYYNSYDEHTNKSTRMFNDLFVSYLNFDSWLQPSKDLNTHIILSNNVEQIDNHQQNLKLATKSSLYNVLKNKWIYFYGDSTLKQLFQTFLRLDHISNNLTSTDIYELYNKNCNVHNTTTNTNNIDISKTIPPISSSTLSTATNEDSQEDSEDISTNIYNHNIHHHTSLNDKICHINSLSQYGSNSRITFDSKQTHYNNYDDWLFSENGK